MATTKPTRPECLLRLEELEKRELLSSNLAGNLLGTGQSAGTSTGRNQLNLFIQGTQVQFNPTTQLPSVMDGNIYPGTSPTGQPIGHYEEALTPTLLNGQFVGTTGVATFRFTLNFPMGWKVETITTADTSLIRGLDATVPGAFDVGSTGTITNSDGLWRGLQGGFTSASVVNLGPSFSLATQVQFTFTMGMGPLVAGELSAGMAYNLTGLSAPLSQGGSVPPAVQGSTMTGQPTTPQNSPRVSPTVVQAPFTFPAPASNQGVKAPTQTQGFSPASQGDDFDQVIRAVAMALAQEKKKQP